MLKVKSFKITDDVGMNELLSKYRIAKNAQILVSEGNILVPYEDGEPLSSNGLKNLYLEMRNDMLLQKNVLEQSMTGLRLQVSKMNIEVMDIKSKMNDTADSTAVREFKKSIDVIENKIKQAQQTIDMNMHEHNRLTTNIEAIDNSVQSVS